MLKSKIHFGIIYRERDRERERENEREKERERERERERETSGLECLAANLGQQGPEAPADLPPAARPCECRGV